MVRKNHIPLTGIFALCVPFATGHQQHAPQKQKVARPSSYKKLVAMTKFDPETHCYYVEKARSILKRGQTIDSYVKQKVAKQRQKMNAIFTAHGLTADEINQIWCEHRLILTTHQHAEADADGKGMPTEFNTQVKKQLQRRSLNPKHVRLKLNMQLDDAQAKTRLLDNEQQIVEKLELNPKKLQLYPRECQEAILNHEAAHLSQHDMLLRILLDAFDSEGKMSIPRQCRNAMCRAQEQYADYLAADTLESARNLRALTAAWYRKYGPGDFFSEHSEHPSPYQRFCKVNKIVLLHEAAHYIQTGHMPAQPPFPHYKLCARDRWRRNENKVIGVVATLSGIGLCAYFSHAGGLWGKSTTLPTHH